METPTTVENEGHSGGSIEGADVARVVLVLAAAAAVWFRVWEPFARVSVIGLVATVVGGWPIFHEAWENIVERRMTMELSMTIALIAALAIGEFFTALVITAFVLVAEILEGMTVERGRTAIRDLLDLLPATVTVRRDGVTVTIPYKDVRKGDSVLVAPGERIAVDGTVVTGHSFVDQSAITGESVPAEKMRGAAVYAGTINQSGVLELVTQRFGRNTSFGKIIQAVEEAERSRAPIQKTADRLAGYLVYFALVCALITFVVTHDARSTISVIIVAGACGIAAGTPLAILGAIGRAARRGAIVKGGRHLETMAAVDTVIFDKTGTITFGALEFRGLSCASGATDRELLWAAATAERRSEHPLGKAIVAEADRAAIPADEPEQFTYTLGQGIVAFLQGERIIVGNEAFVAAHGADISAAGVAEAGESRVFVARGTRFLGTILLADAVRPTARYAVERLRALGMRTVLLTGDARAIAAAVGAELGVDEVIGEALPERKLDEVRRRRAEGCIVAMVGDGINDAPALALASVGIAMGSGTDVARESAGIVLLGNDLGALVDTFELARRTRRTIMQNFTGTLAVDAIGVGMAAFGLLNPLIAALIHVTSEMAFILNSARLVPRRRAS